MKIRPTVCMVKSGLDRFFFCEIVPRLFSFLQIDFTSIYLPSKMEIWLTLKLNKTEYFFLRCEDVPKFSNMKNHPGDSIWKKKCIVILMFNWIKDLLIMYF